jgi:anti-sigma factor RsiW
MIEEKYLELIQADVDGELPEQHRAELSRYLLAHPEARVVRDDLRRLCGALDRVPVVEPPRELKASILGAARLPAPKGGASGLHGFWGSPRMVRYAAVFAGGLLVSAIAFQLGTDRRSGLDTSQVVGTMASPGAAASSVPVDTLKVSLDQVSGTVSLLRSPSSRVLDFELTAKEPVEVVVTHDGQETRVTGFAQAGGGGTKHQSLVLDGPGQAGVPIELRFVAGGTVIGRDTLVAGGVR